MDNMKISVWVMLTASLLTLVYTHDMQHGQYEGRVISTPTISSTRLPTTRSTQQVSSLPMQQPTQLPTHRSTQLLAVDDTLHPTQLPSIPPIESTTQPPSIPPIESTTQPPSIPPIESTTQLPSIPPIESTTQPPAITPIEDTSQLPTQPPSEPPTDSCSEGWDHIHDRCYKVFASTEMWSTAIEKCTSMGADLAIVNPDTLDDLLHKLTGLADVRDIYTSFWVKDSINGTSKPVATWIISFSSHISYNDVCATVDRSTFMLNDSVCEDYLPYLCEAALGANVTTLIPEVQTPDDMCDDNSTWYLYNSHCYKIISVTDDEPQAWWESNKRCRDEGAELASILSFQENYWIVSKMTELSDKVLWIGGRAGLDSGYEWVDGSPFDFENWKKGQPSKVMEMEHCIELYTHNQGFWNDQHCAHKNGRVCKKQHGVTLPPAQTTPLPVGHCSPGWLHVGSKCMKVFTDILNITAARTACQEQSVGAELASVHSAAEQAYLTAIMKTVAVDVWIGMFDIRGFHWMDQTDVTFTNWASGEPDGHMFLGENCVMMLAHSGRWSDVECDTNNGYLCQKPVDGEISTHASPTMCEAPHDDYIRYGDVCYKPVMKPMTWQEAEAVCKEDGAHLASVHDGREDAEIWVIMQENDMSEAWLGFTNMQDGQVFRWSDGWPSFYSNWGSGEPNVTLSEHVCARVSATDGLWSALNCYHTRPFICKYEEVSVPTPDPPVTGHCPDSRWLDLGGSYCYLISEDIETWSSANLKCIHESANLVSIHSEEEVNLILKASHNLRYGTWIGLVHKRNGFGWSDHTGLDFVYWGAGEATSKQRCVEMSSATGRWKYANCYEWNHFICKTSKSQDVGTVMQGGYTETDWTSYGLSAGSIIGIIVAVMLVSGVVGYAAHYCRHKKPKLFTNDGIHIFLNALFSTRDDTIKVQLIDTESNLAPGTQETTQSRCS